VCDMQDLQRSLVDYPIEFVHTAYRSEYNNINCTEAKIIYMMSAQKKK
jgi:hypothetical protein